MLSEMTLPDASEIESLFTDTIHPVIELFNHLEITNPAKDELIDALLFS